MGRWHVLPLLLTTPFCTDTAPTAPPAHPPPLPRYEIDPKVARAQLKAASAAGGLEPADSPALAALEAGVPPLAGFGVGVDRVLMLLTDAADIQEVLPFGV